MSKVIKSKIIGKDVEVFLVREINEDGSFLMIIAPGYCSGYGHGLSDDAMQEAFNAFDMSELHSVNEY